MSASPRSAPPRRALAASGPEHPFEAPAHEVDLPVEWGSLLGFLWQRALRMVVAPLVVVTLGYVVLPFALTWPVLLGLAAIGALLYLPTTIVLFRTRFLRRDPALDELLLSDGERVHAGDYLATVRARSAEEVLGAFPFCLLAVYAIVAVDTIGPVIGVACLLFAAYHVVRVLVLDAIGASTVALARNRLDRAHRRLGRLARLPLPARFTDELWHQLAIVEFRRGRLPAMLAALDRVRDREAWGVDLLRAQALLGAGGLDEARALSLAPDDDPDRREGLEALAALVALHDGRPDDVLAHRARWEAEHETVPAHQARFRDLVLAAALADDEPEAARELLRRGRWSHDRLPWLHTVWPAVGARLAPLDRW